MSHAHAHQFNALPQGAVGLPAAAYAAAPSGVGMGYQGLPMGAAPVVAANEMVFNPVDTSYLPPAHLQWVQPAKKPEGPAGGQLATTGVRLAGTATGLATGTKVATKLLGETVGASSGAMGAVTAGFDAWAGARDRKEAMGQMVEMYAPVIAEQMQKKLGRPITADEINEKALREVAKDNKVLGQALEAYDDGVTWKPAGGAASAVAGGLAFGAIASGPVGWGVMAVGMGASLVASSLASKVFNGVFSSTDVSDTIHAKIAELEQMNKAGQPLSAKDVFSLHARMNGGIQKRMEAKFDTRNFDELSVEKQTSLMVEYQKEMPLMQQEAFLINAGHISPAMAAFTPLNAVAASINPTVMPEAAMPMTPPVMQVETSGAQVSYMQPRAQAQGMNTGGFSANIAAQRAAVANDPAMTLRA